MNPANRVELVGTVHADPRAGDSWTRWKPGGRGQIRFWLAVSRELLGDGFDLFLCAVEPHTAPEIQRVQAQLYAGRELHLVCEARQLTPYGRQVDENNVCVVFVAESLGIEGEAPVDVHRLGIRRHAHVRGKMAAANDLELLDLSSSSP